MNNLIPQIEGKNKMLMPWLFNYDQQAEIIPINILLCFKHYIFQIVLLVSRSYVKTSSETQDDCTCQRMKEVFLESALQEFLKLF